MERQIDLNEISDGRLYGLSDMVRADCGGCAGCSACCSGMGRSVVLDPLDMHRLAEGTGVGAETLLTENLELNVVDGIVLPNLKMTGVGERCTFLDQNGRCTVHSFRPGICRIFPLGRLYENGSFQYFLQVRECRKTNRAKIRGKQWIDMPEAEKYDAYISRWHYFLKKLSRIVREDTEGILSRNLSMYVLKEFYLTPYDRNGDFYAQIEKRIGKAEAVFGISHS